MKGYLHHELETKLVEQGLTLRWVKLHSDQSDKHATYMFNWHHFK
jgi:hypothetical protein